ncbi:MAG: hypothetical protein KDA66_19440, partial [Planctomycetaceae bacterium]|nr:hypothetical protein [Planctomycetaceae bacterium]
RHMQPIFFDPDSYLNRLRGGYVADEKLYGFFLSLKGRHESSADTLTSVSRKVSTASTASPKITIVAAPGCTCWLHCGNHLQEVATASLNVSVETTHSDGFPRLKIFGHCPELGGRVARLLLLHPKVVNRIGLALGLPAACTSNELLDIVKIASTDESLSKVPELTGILSAAPDVQATIDEFDMYVPTPIQLPKDSAELSSDILRILVIDATTTDE